jgi:hypothetical protein
MEVIGGMRLEDQKPSEIHLTVLSANDDIAVPCQKKLMFSRPGSAKPILQSTRAKAVASPQGDAQVNFDLPVVARSLS